MLHVASDNRSPLRRAVDQLIANGVISKDSDLLPALGYKSKGSLSEYLSGKKIPSPKLVKKIEEKFSIVLENFENSSITPSVDIYRDKYIASIEKQLEDTKDQLKFLKTNVSSSLNSISDNVLFGRAEVRAKIEYDALKDAKGDLQKKEAIMEQINKLIGLQVAGS